MAVLCRGQQITRTLALCVVLVYGCAPTPPEARDVAPEEPRDVAREVRDYFRDDSPETFRDDSPETAAARAELEKKIAENDRESSCFGPLTCRNGRCPTYDESVAEVIRLGLTGKCFQAEVGTCGELRFTTIGRGLGGQTEYFNAAGELVAVRTFSDVEGNPNCPFWFHSGERVACSEVIEINHCARFTRRTRLGP
jgi:hypothetical protein